MIQFNLLPDIKVQYIKAQRTKRTVTVLSAIVAAASLALFVMLFLLVNVAQKGHLANLDEDIATSKETLNKKQDLSKILTIQNQLNSLPALHKQKPVASRTFMYIQQLTPEKASVSNLKVNFAEQTIEIEGAADSLATVNTFVDTLKFTSFKAAATDASEAGGEPQVAAAFKEVVLADFGVVNQQGSTTDPNKMVTYTISLKYDTVIFSDENNITLVVPDGMITTRSETEKPGDLFQNKPVTTGEGQ